MRLSQLFNSRHRVAPEPHGANPNKTTPLIPGASPQHPLSQAPKSTTSQGASKSHRGMLASARKSLASLRKQLPLTCMGSSPTLETVESPPAHTAAVTPGRTQQQHGTQARVDQRWQPPVPNATDHERVQRPQPQPQQTPPTRQSMSVPPKPARAQQLHGPQRPVDPRMQPPIPERMRRDEGQPPQHDKPASPPVPITPAQSSLPSPRPQPGRQPSLRRLDLQLEEITRQCSDIQKQLFMEDREATPQEQHLLKTRAALIAWRNEVRDSQLEALLVALAPMEDIRAPRTTSSGLAMVQMDAMQHNRREVLKARRKSVDRAALARNYARAAAPGVIEARRRTQGADTAPATHDAGLPEHACVGTDRQKHRRPAGKVGSAAPDVRHPHHRRTASTVFRKRKRCPSRGNRQRLLLKIRTAQLAGARRAQPQVKHATPPSAAHPHAVLGMQPAADCIRYQANGCRQRDAIHHQRCQCGNGSSSSCHCTGPWRSS